VWFWVSIFILLVLVGVVVTIYNCTSKVQGILEPINTINTIDTNDATDANAEENTADKYSITDEAMESQPLGMYKITGTFTNLTDKEIGYVQVSYNLYDEAGAQIGTAFVNTNNLAAGAQWKFEALCLSTTGDVEPASFKVSDVTGF
jgi:hypothetical protein